MPVTPRIRLSLAEVGPMMLALGVISFRMTVALFTRQPYRAFGSSSARTEYWREIALIMIRTGGYWFSIRHLQFLMPNTWREVWLWGLMNNTPIYSEDVLSVDMEAGDRNPKVHWIGAKPTREGFASGRRVVLYLHGGGFVLPLSGGHISMMTTLLKEANSSANSSAYIAIAEYTIAPYGQYPTQIHQIISVIHHLHKKYNVPSSSLVMAGDSCGGALALSILSHYLHPTASTLPPLPYKLHTDPPLLGLLLISPWTSFSTASQSYVENAERDTLPVDIIRRFRDSYIAGSPLHPQAIINGIRVASMTGRDFKVIPDPSFPGLQLGVGVIRPLGSVQSGREADDDWWAEVGSAVNRILVTAGEYEGFRDDILACANQIKAAVTKSGKGNLQLIVDESFHAVMNSDFSFPVPPTTLMAKLSGWMVDTLRREPNTV